MTRRKFLNKLKKSDVTVDDWAYDLIDSIDNDYAKGRLESYLSEYNSNGGAMDENLKEKANNAPIKNESNNGLSNDRYTISMARRPDVNSATSQFFINTTNNSLLDYPGQDGWGYCVFGEVVKGWSLVGILIVLAAVTANTLSGNREKRQSLNAQ